MQISSSGGAAAGGAVATGGSGKGGAPATGGSASGLGGRSTGQGGTTGLGGVQAAGGLSAGGGTQIANGGSAGVPSTAGGAPTAGGSSGGESTCVAGVESGDPCNPLVDTAPCARSDRTCVCGTDNLWGCTPNGEGGSGGGGGSGSGGANAGGTTSAEGGTTGLGGDTSAGGAGLGGATGTGGGSTEMEWLPSWATTIQKTEERNLPPTLNNNTLRQFIWPTYSGSQVRLQLSNEKGNSAVDISKVHIAIAGSSGSQIDTATDTAFTFNGSPSTSIPAGETAWTDAVDFPLVEMKLTAVTIQFGSTVPMSAVTGHPGSRTTSYIGTGDVVADATITGDTRERWYFIDTLEVMAPPDAFAIGVLGDSITDGYGVDATKNDFARWTDFLTIAVNEDATIKDKVSVLNFGMGANSLLNSGAEQDSGLVRFDRDVIGRKAKIRWVIVLEGVNDIGKSSDTSLVNKVEAAYQQLVEKGNAEGILVYGSPITPFAGNAEYAQGQALTMRNDINKWVRESNTFDAVVDLAEAVADPSNKDRLLDSLSNDGLHPSKAGYEAMGKAVDLSLFYNTMP